MRDNFIFIYFYLYWGFNSDTFSNNKKKKYAFEGEKKTAVKKNTGQLGLKGIIS